MIIVAVVTVPFIVTYNNHISYKSLSEIGEGYLNVKGYDIIEESFGPGEALPAKIILKNDEAMDQTE